MRKFLAAAFTTAIAVSAIGPASAEPARTSRASAYGLQATVLGTQLVPPTPASAVSQPPDSGLTLNGNVNAVLPVDAAGLAVTGVVVAVAEAHRADDIQPALTTSLGAGSDPVTLTGVNSRGLARAENLTLVGNIPLIDLLAGPVAEQGLLSAGSVQAEAVAKCVNGQPVFDTGFNIVDLRLAGGDIPLNELVSTLLGVLNVPGVISVVQGETGRLPDGGVFINALRVSVPLLQADIIVGHAEAAMPANCGIAPPPPPTPTGPGPVAPVGSLAATGGDFSVTPLVAMALLGAAFSMRRLVVRSRPSSSTV